MLNNYRFVNKVAGVAMIDWVRHSLTRSLICYSMNHSRVSENVSIGRFEKVDGFFMNGIMGDDAVYTSVNDYFSYDLALREKKILPVTFIRKNMIHRQLSTTMSSTLFNGYITISAGFYTPVAGLAAA
jgi:hypothetical protein